MRVARIAAVIAVACALLSCGRAASDLRRIRIALPRDAVNWLPVHLAESLGYAGREHIALEFADVPGLSKGVEALLGGSVEVAGGSPMLAVQLAANGRPVQSFFTLNTRPNMAVVALPESGIRTLADLKGRRVGVSALGSPTESVVGYLLASHGLSPRDFNPVAIGTGAASVAAVEHHQVDAAAVVGSVIPMLLHHHPDVAILLDTRRPEATQAAFGSATMPNISFIAREDWLKSHAEDARRLVRAVKEAMDWVRQQAPEQIREKMAEGDRMPDAEADLESIRDMQRALSPDGTMPVAAAETVRKVLAASNEKVRTARLDIAHTFTNEFVDAK